MGTLHPLRRAGKAPCVSAVHEDGAIIVRIEASPPIEAPDELRPIAALAKEWGLERRGLERAIRRAGIAVVRIGRENCVRRSDVVGLVDRLGSGRATTSTDNADDAYAAMVRKAGR